MASKKRKICVPDEGDESELELKTAYTLAGQCTVIEAARRVEDPEAAMRCIIKQWHSYDQAPLHMRTAARRALAARVANDTRAFLVVLWNSVYNEALCPQLFEMCLGAVMFNFSRDTFARIYTIRSLPRFVVEGSADAEIASYDRFLNTRGPFQRLLNDVGPEFVTKVKTQLTRYLVKTIKCKSPLIPDLAKIVAGFCGTTDFNDRDVYYVLYTHDWDIVRAHVRWNDWVASVRARHA